MSRSPTRAMGPALVVAAVLLAAGCSSVQHARGTGQWAGRVLATRSSDGAAGLDREMAYDSSIQVFVEARGRPDYLYVLDSKVVYLFYPARDVVVVFERQRRPPSDVQVIDRIPGHMLNLLPEAELKLVLAQRAKREAKLAPPAPTRTMGSPPAAPRPAGDPGLSIGSFDVDSIVARLREPMSAADPGVSGWRQTRTRDGKLGRSARVGTMQYQVLPASITVMVSISQHRTSPPGELRTGYVRINQAVFGTRALAVSDAIEPLVARVVADASGRTRLVRRVSGRTVSVTRSPAQGLLLYTVHAN